MAMSCVRGMCRLARIPLALNLDFIKEIEATARSAFEVLVSDSQTQNLNICQVNRLAHALTVHEQAA